MRWDIAFGVTARYISISKNNIDASLAGEYTLAHRLCECLVVKFHDMEFEDIGKKLVTEDHGLELAIVPVWGK